LPGATQNSYLNITDPNAGTPALEMRYINQWNKEVTVPAYTKDVDTNTMASLKIVPGCEEDAEALVCKLDGDTLQVRDQHLNDTLVLPISDKVQLGKNGEVGLMQGFLLLLYPISTYTIGVWFDHDTAEGSYINYLGNINSYSNPANIYLSGDNHNGLDFAVPYGTYVFSLSSGWVNYLDFITPNGSKHTTIEHKIVNDKTNYMTGSGHHSVLLVERDEIIYRGEIIALSGNSGTNWPHIHLNFHYQTHGENPPPSTDPFGILFDSPNEFERLSWWTIFNLPVFAEQETISD